jgi:site-specific recombinase XerD
VTVSRRGGTQDMIVWVPEWFRVRYSNSPLTLTKYLESWHAISVFFEERRIRRAEQVRREDVISFVEWRQQPTNGGVRAASRNTALHDLKVLRAILYEALRRGWANQNVAARLGLRSDKLREKPEFTQEQIDSSSSGCWPERTPTCFMMDLRNRWAISRAEKRRDISALIIVRTSWPVDTRIPAFDTIPDAV